jgi:uncharacterized protein YndB with AHSA1/START domain
MSNAIKQKVILKARPAVVYRMLTNARAHAKFTGAPAKIEARAGGAFNVWGGYVLGFNVELVKNKRIVQAWRGSDWPKGAWSVVTYELRPKAGGKTEITFSQHGAPASQVPHLRKGWKSSYWDLMKAAI